MIEMDEITLELYQRELSKSFVVYGFTVMEDALETIARHKIKAVVIEPELQAGKGWEFIHAIRTNCPEKPIPVIICSTREPGGKHLSEDVALYLTKPVLPGVLREKIFEVIGNGK